MGLDWSDLQYLIPGYGPAKLGIDAVNAVGNVMSAPPSQYQDSGQIHNLINQGLGASPNRQAPQTSYANDPFRAGQLGQVQQLQGIANGTQAGAGELAVNRQVQQAQAAQQAQARMARGGNAALAYRNAANNTAGIGLQGAGQASQAQMQDQMNAQGLLNSALTNGRSGDQQVDLANMAAKLQQQGMNDQQVQAYLSQLTGMNATQLQAQMGAAASQRQMVGGMLGAGGQVLGAIASDINLKTDIEPAGDITDQLLDALVPYKYRYKDEKHGVGPRVGIMAQDLERSAAGKDIVSDTHDGKMLDVNKAISAALAGTARLNERVRKLEGQG